MISLRPVCLLLSLLAASLVLASPAAAASCGQQIIDDWADDASPGVDGTYEISCYRDAIASLPDDLRAYSSAADDIRRALQARLRAEESEEQQEAGGGSGSGSSSSGGGESSSGGGAAPVEESGSDKPAETESEGRTPAEVGAPVETSPAITEEAPAATLEEGTAAAPANDLLTRDLDDGSGSLPVPVIVLLAIVGLAALVGAGWLVWRQLQDRQHPAG
jgi:hypothetical protein